MYKIFFIYVQQTQKEWQVVFILTAFIYFVGGLICISLLEADTQPWAIAEGTEMSKTNRKDTTETQIS